MKVKVRSSQRSFPAGALLECQHTISLWVFKFIQLWNEDQICLLPLNTGTRDNLIKHSKLPSCSEFSYILLSTRIQHHVMFLWEPARYANDLELFSLFSSLYNNCRNNGANKIRIGLSTPVCNPDTLETSSAWDTLWLSNDRGSVGSNLISKPGLRLSEVYTCRKSRN